MVDKLYSMCTPVKINLTILIILLSPLLLKAQNMRPEETEDWSKKPKDIRFEGKNKFPSDAVVLFNGGKPDAWRGKDDEPVKWIVDGDYFTVEPGAGSIYSKQTFGSCQLHLEWKVPEEDVRLGKSGQKCGNSGIFLMGLYEVQILNSYENETYYNGQAGSIYKQHTPLVNASLPPGMWQHYDIIFTAPVFQGEGEHAKLLKPAFMTVFHNGVLIQNHVELKGATTFIGHPKYAWHSNKLPLMLQDHKSRVSFRNIWIRDL